MRSKRFQLIHNLMGGQKNPTPGVEGEPERSAVANTDQGTTRARAAIEQYVNPPEFELFDLEKDPENFVNLAGDAQYKEVQEKLTAELVRWREQTNDSLLKPGELKRLGEEVKKRGTPPPAKKVNRRANRAPASNQREAATTPSL